MDNDGLTDVLAVGPADPGWAPRVEVREPGSGKLLRMRAVSANDCHKSGCPLEAH